jgi:hypothetical protein
MLETTAEQRAALAAPVEARFIYQNPHVKGPFTTGDYVRWKMNQIFGPENWSHTILHGPEMVKVSELSAYVQTTVRLVVRFASGETITHDDIGVAVLQATRGSDLDGTMPERYETVLKAAVTDAVKACAEYLGVCFRPLGDGALDGHLRGLEPSAMPRRRELALDAKERSAAKPAPATGGEKANSQPGPTDFWSRFAELERQGLVSSDLRDAPEIKQAKRNGAWAQLLEWLEAQANQKSFT